MDNSNFSQSKLASGKIIQLLETKHVILQFFKFAGIGFLTTALDFLLLNLISKSLSVDIGLKLGGINALTFAIALAHSYIWNANWTFSTGSGEAVLKSLFRAVIVGAVGVVGVGFAVLGGKAQSSPSYYLMILGILFLVEIIIWKSFALGWFEHSENTTAHTMLAFAAVSIVGALINSGLVGLITEYWPVTLNLDLNKNIAKVIATVASLFWNFIGYKVFVFKR